MNFLTTSGIAVGLAMDAFAVALSLSLTLRHFEWKEYLRVSLHFGVFQAVMPILGWFIGSFAKQWLLAVDHWIAFFLLAGIGTHMIFEFIKITDTDIEDMQCILLTERRLLILSLGTSIDALAVGLTFSFLRQNIYEPALIIGVITFGLSFLAMHIGRQLGARFSKYSHLVGGIILIGIGLRILLSHMLEHGLLS